MTFSTRQLRNFVTVLETGSFLRAAENLNQTQPAMSKSIRVLETQLGVDLFERVPRGVQPTAFASVFEKYARRMLADEQAARDELTNIAMGGQGYLNVGIGRPFAEIVADAIADVRKDLPGIEFLVSTAFADELGKLLHANRIDILLAMYNGIQSADELNELHFEHWFTDRFIGLCPAGHEFDQRTIEVQQLSGREFAFPSIEHTAYDAFEALFLSAGTRRPKAVVTTNSNEIIANAIRVGGMLSIVSEFASRTTAFREFGQFEISGFDFKRNVGIAHRKDLKRLPLHNKFIAALKSRSRPSHQSD